MSTRWLKGLNPEQQEAVLHNHGPLLILAGAGSGKTTVLVARTGRLIEERVATAAQTLVLTFTNKAARELKHRVHVKVGGLAEGLWAGTFHSFGLHLLRKYSEQAGMGPRFAVVDSSDCQSILKELMKDVKISGKDRFDTDKVLNVVNDIRAGSLSAHGPVDEYRELAEALAPKFQKRLDLLGVVDFEGLLIKPVELFEKFPEIKATVQNQFQQVMVDEFQDTNHLQMKLIHHLVSGHRNITVVGDDDQSIYGWRGAQIQNILSFPSEFKGCKTVKLERNYRSSASILELANEVIKKNSKRHGKVLRAQSAAGASGVPELFILENEEEEAEFVVREILKERTAGRKLSDMAVLYRSNSQGALLESVLRRNQLNYTITGGTSIFDRKEAKDTLAYLRASLTSNDVAFRRIMNVPARGVGDAALEKINELSRKSKSSFFQAAQKGLEGDLLHRSASEGLRILFAKLQELPGHLLAGNGSPGDRLVQFMDEIGYKAEIISSSVQPGAWEKRWLVVELVGRILDSYLSKRYLSASTLEDFVDVMMLRDQGDDDDAEDGLSLMTLHASKGLEFPLVILVGVEEDLLPHKRLGFDIDEERRLFYVGLTRAKEKLILSRCLLRKKHGALRPVTPSRFLSDLREGLFTEHQGGFRPVSAEERENLVGDFLAKMGERRSPPPKR